jgi:biopolymer transport protein TolR
MAFGAGAAPGGVRSEINVTPLVDVVLVLLIIFMVVTPMLQRGKDVKLPPAHAAKEPKPKSDPLVISITPDHKIWVESNELESQQLESRIVRELAKLPGRRILIKGDSSLVVRDVRQLMQTAKQAGASGVELAIQELKEN